MVVPIDANLCDGKFITTESGDGVSPAHFGEQSIGDDLEQLVANRMAESLVQPNLVCQLSARRGAYSGSRRSVVARSPSKR